MELTKALLANGWTQFSLVNDHGMNVSFLNYGGIITSIIVPDREGKQENVVLGFRDITAYEDNPDFLGALVGRVAGRIKDAAFTLNGETYTLEKNDGENHLHGGSAGFNKVLWQTEAFETETTAGVILRHTSENGDSGYPGTLKTEVTYTLTNENQLILDYHAESDQDTLLALTNHSYFNLSGKEKETVGDHILQLDSSRFVELDKDLIATGNIVNVTGTPFDFRNGNKLEEGFQSKDPQNKIADGGYDHYFLFDKTDGKQASLYDPDSGRKMIVSTNQPGTVIYTANGLQEGRQLQHGISRKHLGVCIETQAFPASLQVKELPSIILRKEDTYTKRTVFQFIAD